MCAILLVPVIIVAILVLRRKDIPRARKYLWGAVFAVIAAPILLFTFGFPFYCIHDYMDCEMNIRRIWIALYKYADDHDGGPPSKLEELHPDYIDLGRIRCPMQKRTGDPLETGYHYITGQKLDWDSAEPLLFCKNYHISGHHVGFHRRWDIGVDRYYALFNILTSDHGIVHATTRDLRKYNGPKRRWFLAFRAYPYDGSKPTLELVQSLKEKFPEPPIYGPWISMDE